MSKLIVIGFKGDRDKASEVLNKLLTMNRKPAVQLNDAVAVYLDQNGELHVDQKYELTHDEGATRGLMLGTVIGGLLAIPISVATGGLAAAAAITVGTAGGAGAGAMLGALNVDRRKEGLEISEEFIRDVGTMIQPGDSAIVAILDVDHPDDVVKQFEGSGGKVLMASLSDEQKAAIDAVLQSGRN